jgi:uncharacterized membrane protein YfcA
LDTTQVLLSFVGGFLAGILNTFAGFGSIITFAIYMDVLGLPGHIANATNRVNVLASSSVSTITFIKNDKLDISKSKWIFITVIFGAVLGILLATKLDNEGFEKAFNYLLIPILILLLVNPKRFIQAQIEDVPTTRWILIPLFFLFGIYAGFIQVGFGVVFLILMVMMAKYDLVHSNAIKVYIIAAYTIIAIIIFHSQGLIDWKSGLMLASGQALGGYVAARNASRMQGANKWAYMILVLIIVVVIIKNFRLWTYFI